MQFCVCFLKMFRPLKGYQPIVEVLVSYNGEISAKITN